MANTLSLVYTRGTARATPGSLKKAELTQSSSTSVTGEISRQWSSRLSFTFSNQSRDWPSLSTNCQMWKRIYLFFFTHVCIPAVCVFIFLNWCILCIGLVQPDVRNKKLALYIDMDPVQCRAAFSSKCQERRSVGQNIFIVWIISVNYNKNELGMEKVSIHIDTYRYFPLSISIDILLYRY